MNSFIEQMLRQHETETLTDIKNGIKEVVQEIVLCGLSRAGFFKEGGVQVGNRGIAEGFPGGVFRQNLRVVPYQPFGQAVVDEFGILIGTGAKHYPKAHLPGGFQEGPQIPVGGIPKEDGSLLRLVDQPGHVGGDDVAPRFLEKLHAPLPIGVWYSEIMEFSGHHEGILAVQFKSLFGKGQIHQNTPSPSAVFALS